MHVFLCISPIRGFSVGVLADHGKRIWSAGTPKPVARPANFGCPGARRPVAGARCPAPGALLLDSFSWMPGARRPVPGALLLDSFSWIPSLGLLLLDSFSWTPALGLLSLDS